MYKSLCVAVLLLSASTVSFGKPHPRRVPVVVAPIAVAGQTAPIPTATILTTNADGLYRLSVYATISTADPNSTSNWYFNIGWTDDAGPQVSNQFLTSCGCSSGPFQSVGGSVIGASPLIFEAKAGTAITYSVTQNGPSDNSVYSLYYTLERLE